jgi:hypothetical protein
MSADQPTTEPTTGSVAVIEDPAETPATTHDDLLAAMADTLSAIGDQLPPGLWKATTTYDRTRLLHVPFDLPDLQIDAWDAETAAVIAKHLPWTGPVKDYVQPGLGVDFYTWDGVVAGLSVRVLGPQPLGGAV